MAKPIILNKTIEIELRGVMTTVKVECSGSWESDGIGAYEFHGYKGFDSGNTYFLIDTWESEVPGLTLTDKESTQVDDAILVKLSDWEHEYTQKCIEEEAKQQQQQTNEKPQEEV